jgi:hypothetical protein
VKIFYYHTLTLFALQAPLFPRRKLLLLLFTKEEDPKRAWLMIHLATTKELRSMWTTAVFLVLQIA